MIKSKKREGDKNKKEMKDVGQSLILKSNLILKNLKDNCYYYKSYIYFIYLKWN